LPAPADSPQAPVRLRRVLVVDDNRIAQQVVGNILRRAHYEVAFASNGNQALEMAAHEQFDAVLMDLQMPDLDGFATTRRLRQLPGCQQLPVFAITSAHSDRDRAFAEEMGMQGYFVRPIIKGELLDALRQHLP
jgi:CheY-like chemotaxis protein